MEYALGGVEALTTVINAGKVLIALILTLKNAKPEIIDRVNKIQYHWHRTQVQLDFVQRIWPRLGDDHQNIQIRILEQLQTKVQAAHRRIRGLLHKRDKAAQTVNENLRVRRFKYLLVKPYLDAVISDLATWQSVYDPSWYLIMKVASPVIDDELRRRTDATAPSEANLVIKAATKVRNAVRAREDPNKHVFLPSEGLDRAKTSTIPYSAAMVVTRPESSFPFVVDSIPCPTYSYIGITTQDIRRLALKMQAVDPAIFGVLRCRGVIKQLANNGSRLTSFEMVFDTPSEERPHSLRSCLLSPQTPSLTDRVNVAKRLAASISYIHTLDFVHKNVRPENMIGFGDEQAGLGPFYLIGFEQVRSDDGQTYMRGSDAWEKNIYRHPDRQGAFPPEKYNMGHDIYSLGVCLLEIGLWSSFVSYIDTDTIGAPGQALGLSVDYSDRSWPLSMKGQLIALAKAQLRPLVGELYTNVVVECLTCLDGDHEEDTVVEEVEEDLDGVLTGVKFIERVLLKLYEISV